MQLITVQYFWRAGKPSDKGFRNSGLPCFTAVLAFITLVSLHAAKAAGFKVTGEMAYWESTATNTIKKQTWTFEVSVIDNQWLETVHGTNEQDDLFGSDGTCVYWIFKDERAKMRYNLTSYVGSVIDGSYPFQSVGVFTALPWIAYCSANTLRAATNGEITLPAPWLSACHDPEAHLYRSHYTNIPDSGGLPLHIDYQLDQESMQAFKSGVFNCPVQPSENRRQQVITSIVGYLSKIDEVEGIYKTTSVTNYERFTIPASFAFEKYNFKNSTNRLNRRYLAGITKGQITGVSRIENIYPYPKLIGDVTNLSVADYRFSDAGKNITFISYPTPDSRWITNKLDPNLQSIYQKSLAKTRYQSKFLGHFQPVAIAALLFLAMLSPIFVLRYWRHHRDSYSKQNS